MNLDKFLKKEFIEIPDLGFGKSKIFNDKSSLILSETGFPLRMIVSKIIF